MDLCKLKPQISVLKRTIWPNSAPGMRLAETLSNVLSIPLLILLLVVLAHSRVGSRFTGYSAKCFGFFGRINPMKRLFYKNLSCMYWVTKHIVLTKEKWLVYTIFLKLDTCRIWNISFCKFAKFFTIIYDLESSCVSNTGKLFYNRHEKALLVCLVIKNLKRFCDG